MVSDAGFGESDRVEIHHIASTQSSLGIMSRLRHSHSRPIHRLRLRRLPGRPAFANGYAGLTHRFTMNVVQQVSHQQDDMSLDVLGLAL